MMPRIVNPNVFPNTMENMNNTMDNMNNIGGYHPCCDKPNDNKWDDNKCNCPTIYKECPPIVTCSKQVLHQYHVTKQPYIHTYHTEVVHHYVTQNEYIPRYTCSQVHVNEPNNTYPNFDNNFNN